MKMAVFNDTDRTSEIYDLCDQCHGVSDDCLHILNQYPSAYVLAETTTVLPPEEEHTMTRISLETPSQITTCQQKHFLGRFLDNNKHTGSFIRS